MSRSKRFLSGVTLSYTYTALVMLVGLWLTPFLLRQIGQHDYGLWLVGTQVLSYLMMLDFGIVGLLPRETAYAMGRAGGVIERATDLPDVIGETLCVVLYQMPLVILAMVLVWFLMPQAWYGFRGPITISLIAFTIMFPLRTFQAVLEGLQDLKFIGGLQIVNWMISTALMVVLVLLGLKLYALAIGWSLAQLMAGGIVLYRVRRHFPSAFPKRLPKLTLHRLWDRFSRGFLLCVSQVAAPLVYGSDVLVIGKIFGPSTVVPYSCTAKLINVLSNQPQLIMQAALPGLSELKAAESRERIFRATTALSQAMLLLTGLAACVTLMVNRGFVDWWVGTRQYAGAELTMMFVVVLILRHWCTTAIYTNFCFGYERRTTLATLLDGLVTVTASILLVRRFGLIGAPIGSMVGLCIGNLPLNIVTLGRELGKNLGGLVAPLLPWFWRFVVLAAVAAWWGQQLGSLKFFQLAGVSALTTLVYGIVMYYPVRHSILGGYVEPRCAALLSKVRMPNRLRALVRSAV